MSHASARVASIVATHTAARSAVGITGATRRTVTPGSAPTLIDAQRVTETESARDAQRRAENGGRAELKRQSARLVAVRSAQRDAETHDDETRAVRLATLAESIQLHIDAMTDASFSRPATLEDWMPRGRFANYARRYDLGFIGWDADDLAMEAFELVTRERNAMIDTRTRAIADASAMLIAVHGDAANDALTAARKLPVPMPRGLMTATGSATAGHTLGEGYRAVKRAYRVGLGFYGYERRGTVVERDDSPRGYVATESHTVTMLKLKGSDESAIRAALIALGGIDTPPLAEVDADTLETVNRRRRGLETLTRRFPLNADGRMLALAALLAEGYTFGETCDALGIAERTAERWASELSRVA